jgi:hypothetical protein
MNYSLSLTAEIYHANTSFIRIILAYTKTNRKVNMQKFTSFDSYNLMNPVIINMPTTLYNETINSYKYNHDAKIKQIIYSAKKMGEYIIFYVLITYLPKNIKPASVES